MSSTLVSYSSGEEEEEKGRKHPDANYDDVQMDMSDDNDESGMFNSKEEYRAYQKQFTSTHQNQSDHTRPTSEYGSGARMPAAATSYAGAHSAEGPPADRQPRRSTDNSASHHQSSTSRRVDDSGGYDEHSRNIHKDRRRGGDHHHEDSRRGHKDSRHRHNHRDHRRDRSRSRSRDRDRQQQRRRRSRSRDRDRDDHRRGDHDRRHSRDQEDNRNRFPRISSNSSNQPPPPPGSNASEQDRQDSRNRKLQSLGLVNNKGETLASQMEKVKEITGVEVPSYYNPAAINPLKYAEQIKKRQML